MTRETRLSWPYCTHLMQDGAPAHRSKATLVAEKELRTMRLE